jgi:hypothetical protein
MTCISSNWKDHVHQMMTGDDRETLTMEIEGHEEDQNVIEHHINKGQKYNEAFHVATGIHFFPILLFFMPSPSVILSYDKRLSPESGFFPLKRHKMG